MTHEQFEKAANYWKNKEQTAIAEAGSRGVYQDEQYLCACNGNR